MSICLWLHLEKERQTVHKTFEIPLDIPDVTIEKTETNRHGDFVITVKSTIEAPHSLYKKSKSCISREACALGRLSFKPMTCSCYALYQAALAWERRVL